MFLRSLLLKEDLQAVARRVHISWQTEQLPLCLLLLTQGARAMHTASTTNRSLRAGVLLEYGHVSCTAEVREYYSNP